jgi:pimeloyl-ACP methyl ester carboxylesterase
MEQGPDSSREGEAHRLTRPDGSVLQVEMYGPKDGPPIVLTHGWGVDSTEWTYLKRQLSDRYRLIVWDLPGLGLSRRPSNNDYSLENLARDLDAVLGLADGRPAVLVGHSIGGMATLTFARLFPEALGSRVAGLVLVHTTYTNPVRTAKGAAVYTALENPVIIPLLYLTIGLAPIVWLMNWMRYFNGSAHVSTIRSGFAGTQTWEQVDFMARFQPIAWPGVIARGMLGMLKYDATDTLRTISVPTLVIPGDRDPVCPPEAGEKIARDVPDAQLERLVPAKHSGLFERNEDFAKMVSRFVSSCSTVTASSSLNQG